MSSRLRSGMVLASFVVAVLAGLAISCTTPSGLRSVDIAVLSSGGTSTPIKVELACTQKEQERGYMERKTIPDGTGMVFAYQNDQIMHYWMKNTPHPLSIAYISSDGIIRDIFDMQPFSLEVISSSRSVRYALEVPQGWFSHAGIAPGDTLTPESLSLLEKAVSGN